MSTNEATLIREPEASAKAPLPLEPLPNLADRHSGRPEVRGKFLFVGEQKLWVKGVTYGTFAPRADGAQFPEDDVVANDFAAISEAGFNTVRLYTPPPRGLLDIACRCGLRVLVGLSWTQHVTFLDDPDLCRRIRESVRTSVRECAAHQAVLAYAIGNEIPASIVRWHGRKRIEKFLRELYSIVKEEDPSGLATYVNFPTTEYLRLPFLDFVSFNVYLESGEKLNAYLSRLQNLTMERPLVLAELGLDSRRNGLVIQAETLQWQLRSSFDSGCAGTFIFAWTDEWHRGGADIDDWQFGLTTRERLPKPAMGSVRDVLATVPFGGSRKWPMISVVVCSLNGGSTIRETMEGLARLDYPNYEVIVIDDGSTDNTGAIAAEYPVRVISTENQGLSNARNAGWRQAAGEIVAYIDDDAWPDPDWLGFLAVAFENPDFVGVGGPNLSPAKDGWIADCIANAPGGPVHVLVTDTRAEHIPGCNMAFRRQALNAIAGFDPVFRAAGDDVDICWRLQARGWTIGFSPAAVVWHHRRNSLRKYWKQQQGYGKAEALLERKWPQRYNSLGHPTWSGRLYGNGVTQAIAPSSRIYQGSLGSAPFQLLYEPSPKGLASLPLMPEWYLLIGLAGSLVVLGSIWAPLFLLWPLLAFTCALPIAQAIISARRARFPDMPGPRVVRQRRYALTMILHLVQPLARLAGRLNHGLRPWRTRSPTGADIFQKHTLWRETWQAPQQVVRRLYSEIQSLGGVVLPGGDFDDWDLEVRGGLFGSVRVRTAVEEHGSGTQLYRFATIPRVSTVSGAALAMLSALLVAAACDGAWAASLAFLVGLCAMGHTTHRHIRAAAGTVRRALSEGPFTSPAESQVPG